MTLSDIPHSTPLLMRSLQSQRRHVLGTIEGLSEDGLKRPVLPSGWTCAGLIQHLTLDVERFWFRGVVAGDQEVIEAITGAGNSWLVAGDISGQAVIEEYQREVALADEVLATLPTSAPLAWWPNEIWPDWRYESVEQVILHVLTETATHAGHLDAVRELIDSKQWLVLD